MGNFILDNPSTAGSDLDGLLQRWWQDYIAITPVVICIIFCHFEKEPASLLPALFCLFL